MNGEDCKSCTMINCSHNRNKTLSNKAEVIDGEEKLNTFRAVCFTTLVTGCILICILAQLKIL